MPRINVEDAVWADERFHTLSELLGCRDKALGMLVRAWRLAQSFWLKDRSLIPVERWTAAKLSDHILEVGWGEIRQTGIYMHGSETSFAWIEQRVIASGKGVKAKADKKAMSVTGTEPVGNRSVIETQPVGNRHGTGRLTSSSSSSSSSDPSSKDLKKDMSVSASPTPTSSSSEDTPSEDAKEPCRTSKRTREVPKVPSGEEIAPEAILTLWNETRPQSLSAIRDLSGKRLKTLQKRIKQFPKLEEWQTAIRNLSSSPFHCGDGWRADFDWLLSEKGIRCFEGPLGSNTKRPPRRTPTTSAYGADPLPAILAFAEPIDLEAIRRTAAEIENERPKRRRM